MSYPYEPQGWQGTSPVRQPSWEQPPPPSRSEASSTSQREDSVAFAQQFDEIDRAFDNLVKSGKFFPGGPQRREPGPMAGSGRSYGEFAPRGHSSRQGYSEFDPNRSHSGSNLQNFYASQRYGRPNDGEQMAQAKRRMAAQRERELRNYHQEQQYNRSTVPTDVSSAQSDRSQSPSTMSEEGRRDLIARQHRALYGGESSSFLPQGLYGENDARENNAGTQPGNNGQAQGNSPPAQDLFRMTSRQGDGSGQSNPSLHEKNRMDKTASPSTGSGPPTFGTFEPASQQSGRNPTPPSSGEGHSRTMSKSTTAPVGSGMGPIGSRPNAQQGPAQGLNKRTTSPLPNQPLSYGSFGTAESTTAERTASSNSNSNQKDNQTSASGSSMGAWGTGSGVWGSSNKIGTTSVWG